MYKFFSILTIFKAIEIFSIDCTCSKSFMLTTTENINYRCQLNTGVRLNSTALAQLVQLGAFNYTNVGTNADDCCLFCNKNKECDYAFEIQYNDGSSQCEYYHWNIPNSLTEEELVYQIKQGFWYEKKSYSRTSGKLLYANKFIQLTSH